MCMYYVNGNDGRVGHSIFYISHGNLTVCRLKIFRFAERVVFYNFRIFACLTIKLDNKICLIKV